MALVYLGLGSNLGDKIANLKLAVRQLELQVGVVLQVSSFYPTQAWGYRSDHTFMNAVAEMVSDFTPEEILYKVKKIEEEMGRMSAGEIGYSDRTIDIDILFYDNRIIHSPELQIPHPLIQERDFVLLPMSEIAPDYIHPKLNDTMRSLKNKLLTPESGNEKFAEPVKKFPFPTKRFCQTLDLKEDSRLIEEYRKYHSGVGVWSEIPEGIREIGVLEMEIYLLGNRLFMILEVPADFRWDEAFGQLAKLPRQREWEELMAKFQEADPNAGSAEKWKLMERIFWLPEV